MDREARRFDAQELALLEHLAGIVMEQLDAQLDADPRGRRAADRYEAMASRLIDPPPIGVLMVDQRGTLVFISEAAERMLGPQPDEGIAELIERICEGDASGLLDVLDGSSTAESEITIRGRVARRAVVPLTWRVERSGDGGSQSQHMVTVRPAATEPEYVEAVLEAQKLESLGVLAGGVAHDLNNILGAIMGNTGLARESLGDHGRLLRYLSTIDQATDRATALCEQLLVYAGGGQFSTRATDLSRLIDDMSVLLEASLSKKTEMNFVQGDESVLHRITAVYPHSYETTGDANRVADSQLVSPSQIRGVGIVVVPFVGLPATWLNEGRWFSLSLLLVSWHGGSPG
jgi:signal transduction histidine kinase